MSRDNTKKVDNDGVIFVKGSTPTKGLSTCIFATATKEGREEVRLRGIGAGANNQMTKAIIVAKGRLLEKGISLSMEVYFKDIPPRNENEDVVSAIEYMLKFTT